jgi:hypothetical protein
MLESRPNPLKGGFGMYALQPVAKGTLLAMFGGTIVDSNQLTRVPAYLQSLGIQVEDDLYLISTVIGPGDHFNHSCDPNTGMYGQLGLVAMRDIEPGEEITFDYAMSDCSDYDEFECMCGSENCRRFFRGTDWRDPALWEKYDGYFSLYLQRRINQLRVRADHPVNAGSELLAESTGKIHAALKSDKV